MDYTGTINLKPFSSYPHWFYVFVGDDIVAVVEKVDENSWRAGEGVVIYDNPLMAAFSDANLADPASWSE